MNGDLGIINNKIEEIQTTLTTIETKQEERHTANIERMKKLDNLPCEVHVERMKGFSTRINWLYVMFGSVVLGGIVLGLWVHGAMAQ